MTCNTPQLAFNRNAGQCQCESALDSSDYYVIDAYKKCDASPKFKRCEGR